MAKAEEAQVRAQHQAIEQGKERELRRANRELRRLTARCAEATAELAALKEELQTRYLEPVGVGVQSVTYEWRSGHGTMMQVTLVITGRDALLWAGVGKFS